MAEELKQLHHEVETDLQHLDSLQKRMAVDMLKDKVIILRGMRELLAESKRNVEGGSSDQVDNSENTETEDHEDDPEPAESAAPVSQKRLNMTGVRRAMTEKRL